MATSEQLKRLVKAYYERDDEKFRTVVLQIAAHEAKIGHVNLAQELKKEALRKGRKPSVIKLNPDNHIMFDYSMPSVELSELIVSDAVKTKVNRIMIEYKNKRKLYNSGLSNRRKILLEGYPGTGKTMTASVIASELRLPLFAVQVDKLVTKFMGETSVRLRQIFESMSTYTGVYFFDEFDAIGADRSMDNEVGEMRRILNAFLQFIETDASDSIIVAATNNNKILDKALFRRFDDVIHYDYPDEDQIRRLLGLKLGGYNLNKKYSSEIIQASKGLSHAELSLVCDDAIKDYILYGNDISSSTILSLLNERHRVYKDREA